MQVVTAFQVQSIGCRWQGISSCLSIVESNQNATQIVQPSIVITNLQTNSNDTSFLGVPQLTTSIILWV